MQNPKKDLEFLNMLIYQTDTGITKWLEVPYQVYLYENEFYKLKKLSSLNRGGFYLHLLENMEYICESNTTVYRSEIEDTTIFFIQTVDFDYALPKKEYKLHLISSPDYNFVDNDNSNSKFSYMLRLDDFNLAFSLMEKLYDSIISKTNFQNDINAQEFMRKFTV